MTYLIFILIFIGLPFIYTNSLFDPVLISRYIGANSILLIGYLYLLIKKYHFHIPLNFLTFSWLGYFVFSGLSLANALNIVDGIFEFSKILMVILSILLLFNLINYFSVRFSFISLCITVSCTIQCLIAFLQKTTIIDIYGSAAGQLGTLTHPNQFSIYILTSLPFLFYCLRTISDKWRIFPMLTISMVSVLLIITKTRSAWFAGSIMGITGTGIILWQSQLFHRLISFIKIHKKIILIDILLTAILLVSFIISDYHDISEHVKSIPKMESSGRFEIWNSTFDMIIIHPLLGVGIGNWKLHIKAIGDTFWQRPHNDYLWVLAESGIFSLICYLCLTGFLLFQLIQILRIDKAENQLTSLVIILALSAFCSFSIFTFPKERILHLLFFALVNAVVLSFLNAKQRKISIKFYFLILPVFFISACIFIGAKRFEGERATKHILNSAFLSPSEHIKQLSKINPSFYNMDPVSTPIQYYLGMSYIQQNKLLQAKLALLKAYKLNPNHPLNLANLATTYELSGERDKAIQYYQEVLNLYPDNNNALINLAIIYYQKKEFEKVRCLINKVIPEDLKTSDVLLERYMVLQDMISHDRK